MAYSYSSVGSRCLGECQAGCKALLGYVVAHWPNASNLGCYNCRNSRGGDNLSLHAEGRAIDVGFPYQSAGHTDGHRLAEFLVAHAEDEELGIQRVIWARREWDSRDGQRWWSPYYGASAHLDHIHVELTWPSAKGLTSQRVADVFSGQAQGDDDLPYTEAQLIKMIHDTVLQVVRKEGISGANALNDADKKWVHDAVLMVLRKEGISGAAGAVAPSKGALDNIAALRKEIRPLVQDEVRKAIAASDDQLRKSAFEEAVRCIRMAVGPDDAKTPAGKYFGRMETKLDELLGR